MASSVPPLIIAWRALALSSNLINTRWVVRGSTALGSAAILASMASSAPPRVCETSASPKPPVKTRSEASSDAVVDRAVLVDQTG